ncbi:hypothetical protein DY000_02016839 [Brassica cretica]|uniref:Uncharacterized protein n=1 Tax=Brassica cretica TaxID=69181 RepID=A0ABQ7D3T4_BRACR|nr:hypothetical protein DY000_02016839 [Brassica cretica]
MKSTVNVHHLNAFNIFSKRVRCTLITGFDITRSHLSNNGESKQQSLDGLKLAVDDAATIIPSDLGCKKITMHLDGGKFQETHR